MSKRGLIGFIIANPEEIFQQRLMDGIFSQCRKYGFDCAVFSPLVKTDAFFGEYLSGEVNILELINFDKLDGVIVATFSFNDDKTNGTIERITELLKEKCTKPVVSLGLPLLDYPVVSTDDRTAFSLITDHLIDVHGCKDIYFLAGNKGNAASNSRIAGFIDSMKRHMLHAPKENVFYGDFSYGSGEQFAEKLLKGDICLPEAVICANDCMAIGLINRLDMAGVMIPDELLVTGFDATPETVVNRITLCSFLPDTASAAAEAINIIVKEAFPELELIPTDKGESGLKPCASCGCAEDVNYIRDSLRDALIVNPNMGNPDVRDSVKINDLLESYIFENFTSSESTDDCISKISESVYLLRPFEKYYLCLEENWADADMCPGKGYPDEMILNVISTRKEGRSDVNQRFDTSLMLPQLYEEREYPCVFYFAPMHFRESTMGYSVLQCGAAQKHKINTVFRNWIRNVNNALEMTRTRSRLTVFSERDTMTGLYNRRGMETRLKKLTEKATTSDSWLVFVIDMDGLKRINDTYGHSEGDYGIAAVASAVRQIARSSEICVRAGGDEFYVIGLGDYRYTDAIFRIEKFKEALAEENKADKPYEISASIGFSIERFNPLVDINDIISLSDSRMYENKVAGKKAR